MLGVAPGRRRPEYLDIVKEKQLAHALPKLEPRAWASSGSPWKLQAASGAQCAVRVVRKPR